MQNYKGWLFLASLLLYLLFAFGVIGLTLPTLCAWGAALLHWPQLGSTIKIQAGSLLGLGLLLLGLAASQNSWLGLEQILSINLPLLAMFSAVSFLALTNPDKPDEPLPLGKKSIASTALGVNLLGAIINLSVIFIMGDRLAQRQPLSNTQQIILTRCFCAAAWWSPFFIATAVSLTYAPGMQWLDVLVPGALMAGLAILISVMEVMLKDKGEFAGYPIKAESLRIPLLLACSVIALHFVYPAISIILIITCLAPIAALSFAQGPTKLIIARNFIRHRLPNVGSQFVLFLAAGVFSAGIKSLLAAYPDFLNLQQLGFSASSFALILAMMIIAGMLGVHPVVSIAVASPLLLPLEPDPSQLGFLFLSSWAISAGSSPLSGVGLTMMARYQFSNRQLLQNNWHYAILMWFSCSAFNAAFL